MIFTDRALARFVVFVVGSFTCRFLVTPKAPELSLMGVALFVLCVLGWAAWLFCGFMVAASGPSRGLIDKDAESVLAAFGEDRSRLTSSDIAKRTAIDEGRVCLLLNRLAERGLVNSTKTTADAGGFRYVRTAFGDKMYWTGR